ncbi:MAG: N-acetyltransferase [Clostridia bacterium]|nr:N-acetyltransferase [Clostridia bacterium]
MIEIREVKGRRDMRKFAKYPVELYKDCPYYVPSLRSDEIATFNPKKNFNLANNDCKAFLAYKDGKIVGRIAGLINKKDNELTGKKYIRFSRFECIDDEQVFRALLGAVEKFGKENGMEIIHGPWGFNDTDREGMLTEGFDKRSTYSTNYYYPYFHERMESLGYEDESKWHERSFTIPDVPYERITSFCDKLKDKLKVVDVSETMSLKKIIKNYGVKLFDTLNEAYAHLDGYVPIVGKSVDNVLSQFATIVNLRYVSILVDENDDVAAFGIVLPSIADSLVKHRGKLFPLGFIDVLKDIKAPKELEMALIGVKKKYKNTGINSLVINKIMKNVIADGITHIESNPSLDDNYSIQQQWKFADSEIIKRRQTYKKKIEA